MSKDRKGTLVGFMFGLAGLVVSLSAGAAGDTPIATTTAIPVDRNVIQLNLGTPISIECKNPGSHQDVAKTPVLKNTAGAAIKKGTALFWKSTDGDYGSVKLEADLAPGATVQGLGKPGNAYQCSSNFLTKPDLTIRKAQFASQTSANVELQNLDGFLGAGPSIVKVEVVSCSGPVLASAQTAPVAVAKGEVKPLTVTFPATSGKRYLRVKADATSLISEKSETNNLWDDMDSCIH